MKTGHKMYEERLLLLLLVLPRLLLLLVLPPFIFSMALYIIIYEASDFILFYFSFGGMGATRKEILQKYVSSA